VSIYFSPEAMADLEAAIGYLNERNPTAARELHRRIFAAIDKLARRDFDGPEQALHTGHLVRSWPVPPIRIYYQRRPDALWIVRLYHQAQPPIVR
jgi:plasmid stabilization system protein ParE